MTQQLSTNRYVFLLEQSQKGESLSPSEFDELRYYKGVLGNQISYNLRFDYLPLLEDYIQGKIDLDPFLTQFDRIFIKDYNIYISMVNNVEDLSNFTIEFEIASKMEQFTALIDEIWEEYENWYCNEFDKAYAYTDYKPNIERTIDLIHETYHEIKKCLE